MVTALSTTDTVRLYNDCPDCPTTPVLLAAERAYREAFLAGAREAAGWDMPDPEAIAESWRERRRVRGQAEVLVSSAEYFNDPMFDEYEVRGQQVVYRSGHEVEASRARGRVQALELAKQCWGELSDANVEDEEIRRSVMAPWLASVERWAPNKIEPARISPPPHPDKYLSGKQRRMVDALGQRRTNFKTAAKESAKPRAITRRLTDVEREVLEWLWPGRIPLGKLTLLAGDPGLGKSFVTLDMAARVSRGSAWPDLPLLKQTAGGVVLFNAEDDIADTIAPRLDKAEADDHNILIVEGVTFMDRQRHFTLEEDLPRLQEVLTENPDARLVVIDPVSAYTGKVDSHNNSDVRGLLAPLSELAGRHRVAVVAVTHLSKSGGTKAVYRAMGSLAFAAASRAVWAIVKDPDDPGRRLFLPAKLNLAQDPDGLAYRISDGRVAWETTPVRMHADDAFVAEARAAEAKPRGNERQEAMDWLRDQLSKGAVPAAQVIEDGKECGFSERTLRRAYKEIGSKPRKASFDGQWLWGLPDQDGHEDGHEALLF